MRVWTALPPCHRIPIRHHILNVDNGYSMEYIHYALTSNTKKQGSDSWAFWFCVYHIPSKAAIFFHLLLDDE